MHFESTHAKTHKMNSGQRRITTKTSACDVQVESSVRAFPFTNRMGVGVRGVERRK